MMIQGSHWKQKRKLERSAAWGGRIRLVVGANVKTEQRSGPSDQTIEIAIIGAGPYGLSIAAHLNARDIPFRIFGSPMSVWATQMPRGMRLKSEGFASSLSEPKSEFALRDYCRQERIPYSDVGEPVSLETFVAYGLAFQKRFVPNLENRRVTSLRREGAGFELLLEDGEKVFARRVVVAVGITYFANVPAVLAGLRPELVSHSSAHGDLAGFRGRRIAVIGAGASALDLAGLLHAAGASVDLIARAPSIRFQEPPRPRSWTERLRYPRTGIGSGLDMVFYAHLPHWFQRLPERLRLDRVRKILGPAPGWFSKNEVVGKVSFHLGMEVAGARNEAGRVFLELTGRNGQQEQVEADHVIAATGYQVDLHRVAFLDAKLHAQIRKTGAAPALSASFQSSVPGLYFVGVSAANSFGPLMRFAFGAKFTARRLARHLARVARQPAHYESNQAIAEIRRANQETRIQTDGPIS
jgi:cation diffusion facilitator CzcD-associated flavoprotein CzcO